MERSALGRSALFVVLVASIALTGQSTFGGMTECRGSPGPPAAQGMHWYYRVDRTNNRPCWYLQSAGLQVRSHEIVPVSKPRPEVLVEPSLAPSQKDDVQTSPSQPPTAEGVLIQRGEPPIGTPVEAHFTARWPDLPALVDLDAPDFAPPSSDYSGEHALPHSERPVLSEPHFTARWPDLPASVDLGASDFAPPTEYSGEHALPYSEQPVLSTQVVLPDTISRLPHKSANGIKFGSVFIAGAISVILFRGLLKFIRVLSSSLGRVRLKSKLDDGSEINLSELMWALRRVDDTLKRAETRSYSPRKPFELVAHERAPQREHLDRRPQSAPARLIRYATDEP